MKAYNSFKMAQVKNQVLVDDDGKWYKTLQMPYHPLQVVQIYFGTATYDKIVNDVSVRGRPYIT